MAVTRVFDILPQLLEKHNKSNILAAKENGQWRTYSTKEFADNVNFLSSGLYNLGIKPGDKIAIIANNRPEWNFTDYAIQQVGAISVPIYPTISETDLGFILKDAAVTYLFISSKELYTKLKPTIDAVSSIKDVYSFNTASGCKHWSLLLEDGKKNPKTIEIESIKKTIKANDLLTILYTSGTTGTPKGVMLSHNNLISNSLASQTLAPFKSDWKALSFLPLNHVYERMLTTLYFYLGVSVYYAESMDTIVDNLKEVQPQIFSTVPRLLEKVYDRIVAKGNEQKGLKKKIFFWALDLGLRYELNGANGWFYEQQLKIARKLVFSKWKEALGGKVVAIVSGGAALQPRLSRVFFAAQINVLEGYGLTETSPVIAVNNFLPNSICFGTVGPVIDKVTVKIAEDGEILVKGPNIMLGYYNRPDATAEVIDTNGWFHTGDIGTFVDNRFLKITDRKKEIFKTSGGKYITPVMIENKLKESPFIEQIMVIGENQKFASALIVPSFAYLKDYCKLKNIEYNSNEEIIQNPVIKKRIMEEVEQLNKSLAQYEKIKAPELLSREWSIEKNELTPKLSLKRKVILTENKELVDKIYREKNGN
ncbi:MAG TPA: long-chain fatty acid--CoA ligase [Bacteroidia bacterium]|jgi:long-chain acyl-CoA synthetase|nr:long-chain fatty acid--CoA ligase [Bacteroidia bacterium]